MTGDPVTVLTGDCREVLRSLPGAFVDAVVTDPPYGIGFMGKEWDGPGKAFVERGAARQNRFDHVGGNHNPSNSADQQRTHLRENRLFGEWATEWAAECLRVLKPGGHLVAFGGTRTFHRLTCAVEDAGFEIRDSIGVLGWAYGSGFPKSMDVSKAIDKAAGAERQVVGRYRKPDGKVWNLANDEVVPGSGDTMGSFGLRSASMDITAPATSDAARWAGWGTGLKPAWEPIVLARKTLDGTVVTNVLAHGVGALNVDGCRVPAVDPLVRPAVQRCDNDVYGAGLGAGVQDEPGGRWPPNVALTHAPLLDDGGEPVGDACADGCVSGCPVAEMDAQSGVTVSSGGSGASRFFPVFRYQAKAPAKERPKVDGVVHPTVKPLALMRWLVRLVTPPGGVVLDPFAGSGTTGEAAVLEGKAAVLVEREPTYLPLIAARLDRLTQLALDVSG